MFWRDIDVSAEARASQDRSKRKRWRRAAAAGAVVALSGVSLTWPIQLGGTAGAAPVGQGFTVTASDLSFILQQIEIAEAHVRNTTEATGPCGALVGPGPDQIPSPLVSFGLRTVDGSCNNLQPGQDEFGSAQRLFPRLTTPVWRSAEAGTTYASTTDTPVYDSRPRLISNLIADQTSTNPAAVIAAGYPVRTQADPDAYVPCTAPGVPVDCVPQGETLPILNVTTDIGLSPPNNGLFTIFGQFFSHGLDKITNGGNGTVVVPLANDDPIPRRPGAPAAMVLTRSTVMGPNGTREAENSDTPWVDLSQAYASNSSHQVFIREYSGGAGTPPASTGLMLARADGGLPNWNQVKAQAAEVLGLQLVDLDIHDIPVVLADAYGNFIPGPNGLPQWVAVDPTTQELVYVEGDQTAPVPAPENVLRTRIAFLNDIANPADPAPGLLPDGTTTAGPDGFLTNVADTYFDESIDDVITPASCDAGALINLAPSGPCGDDPASTEIDESTDDIVTDASCNAGALVNLAVGGPCGDDPNTVNPADESIDDVLTPASCDAGALINLAPSGPCGDDPGTTEIDESTDDIVTDASCNAGALVNLAPGGPCGDDPNTTVDETLDNVFVNDGVAGSAFGRKPAGAYDDELLGLHFIAGDGRVNENVVLTAVHQVFHSEHDRVAETIHATIQSNPALKAAYEATGAGTFEYGERLFQAARFVTEMEYQHLVFEEYARKVQPGINPFQVFAFGNTDIDPAITAEFAHAVFRFGHSQLREDIARTAASGASYPLPLIEGFLNPGAYHGGLGGDPVSSREAAGAIIMGMSDQVGNEIDEFVTDTLRNSLLGAPLDLATLNLARNRSEGVAPLNEVRRQLHAQTNDPSLTPYTSWIDFGLALRHPASLVNFVAAYGRHDSIVEETTIAGKREAARLIVNPDPALDAGLIPDDAADFMESVGDWAELSSGLNDVDLWIGGLAENTNPFGGILGSTFNHIFERQLTDLQNGDRFYYLARTPGMNLRTELEGNSFAEIIMRNTTAHSLKADPFAVSDCKFQLGSNPGVANRLAPFNSTTIQDDPASECDENALLIRRTSDNQIRYRPTNSVDPSGINGQSVFNGTSGVDNVYGGNDNDTFLGNEGNDIMDGGSGSDVILGGEGNDRLTDFSGDDVLKGGPGNDALDAGAGLDILMGGDGSDFTNGGDNGNDHFLGAGNDFAIGGVGGDMVIGDGGDDWLQGGAQQDLLIGDSSTFFFTDFNLPGNDVFIGQSGDDDYDGEGGDDIFLGDPGLEKNSGAAGFDWFTGIQDPQALNEDLNELIVAQGQVGVETRSRFFEVEALSGGNRNDVLRGDDVVPVERGGDGSIGCDALDTDGVDRITGLDQLVDPAMRTVPAALVQATATTNYCMLEGDVWGAGNIIIGGLGSDLLEGRGADDIIDGDRFLNVRLSVRTDVDDPSTEIGSTDLMERVALTGNFGPNTGGRTLQQAVFLGLVDPGNIAIVREIITPAAPPSDCGAALPLNCDTVVFNGAFDDYDLSVVGTGLVIDHARGTLIDGVDTVRNVERLQFTDTTILLAPPGQTRDATAVAGLESADVTWTEPVVVFPGLNSYQVHIEDVTTGTPVPSITDIDPDTTSTTVEGLVAGRSYRFTVSAVNVAGVGVASAPTNAVVPYNLPGAPTNVVAVVSGTSINASWTAPGGIISPALSSYTVRAYDSIGVVVSTQAVTAPATSVRITDLGAGTYTVRVTASNARGDGPDSTPSAAVNIVPLVTLAPVNPVSGDTNVPIGRTVTARFSTAVTGVSLGGSSTNVILERIDGLRIPAVVSMSSNALIINPDPLLEFDTVYRVRVLAGSCTAPESGIRRVTAPCAAFFGTSWTFRTEPNTPPVVTARTPAIDAVGFDRDFNVTVSFSEPVSNVDASTLRLTRVSDGVVVPATFTMNVNSRVVTVNPTGRLVASTLYRVYVGENVAGTVRIVDALGEPLVPVTWTFTTGLT